MGVRAEICRPAALSLNGLVVHDVKQIRKQANIDLEVRTKSH